MKKLLLSLALVAATFAVQAQTPFRSLRFIPSDIASITISNTFMLTNLNTAWVGLGVTNFTGITYTNQYGVRTIIVGAATGNTKNLLRDVPLWASAAGAPPYFNTATNNSSTVDQRASYINLSTTWVTGSGTDQPVTFTFVPITDGAHETTTAAEEWSVSFTPIVSSTQTLFTNVPIWRWPGASGLRLRRVTYADTTAVSQLTLTDISLNGFIPQ